MHILKRDNLKEGGFAGLREHRLIKEPTLFGAQENNDGSWPGKINNLGNFVYLADARFQPHGETHMHSHHEIDVISVMVEGNISHEGSLEHGRDLTRNDAQVQRAGGEGFTHNEINPDNEWNRLIQLWVLPETSGQPAEYKVYTPKTGKLTRIYGGEIDSADFPARTKIDIGVLTTGDKIKVNEHLLVYITRGHGLANNKLVEDGNLIRAESLIFEATTDVQLIVIYVQ